MEKNLRTNARFLSEACPGGYDVELAREKGLADETGFGETYFELQHAYVDALWAWLDAHLGIGAKDQELRAREERFIPARNNPVSMYEAFWSNGLDYFFLRSEVHIERLSEDDLRLLERVKDDPAGAHAAALMERTALEVTRVRSAWGENDLVAYEPSGVFAPNTGIVLGLATRLELGANGRMLDPLHEEEKDRILAGIARQLTKDWTKAAGFNVTVLVY
ncbi:MAG: hypothetical protein ACI4PG_08245 [Candidatus Ventricola sp.]